MRPRRHWRPSTIIGATPGDGDPVVWVTACVADRALLTTPIAGSTSKDDFGRRPVNALTGPGATRTNALLCILDAFRAVVADGGAATAAGPASPIHAPQGRGRVLPRPAGVASWGDDRRLLRDSKRRGSVVRPPLAVNVRDGSVMVLVPAGELRMQIQSMHTGPGVSSRPRRNGRRRPADPMG